MRFIDFEAREKQTRGSESLISVISTRHGTNNETQDFQYETEETHIPLERGLSLDDR